jgi:hypothetical protein
MFPGTEEILVELHKDSISSLEVRTDEQIAKTGRVRLAQ